MFGGALELAEIKIDREKCKGCELCVYFCPKKCIEVDESYNGRGVRPAKWSSSSANKCTGCAICANVCPDIAIEVWR